jgi:hypothetical protein
VHSVLLVVRRLLKNVRKIIRQGNLFLDVYNTSTCLFFSETNLNNLQKVVNSNFRFGDMFLQ